MAKHDARADEDRKNEPDNVVRVLV